MNGTRPIRVRGLERSGLLGLSTDGVWDQMFSSSNTGGRNTTGESVTPFVLLFHSHHNSHKAGTAWLIIRSHDTEGQTQDQISQTSNNTHTRTHTLTRIQHERRVMALLWGGHFKCPWGGGQQISVAVTSDPESLRLLDYWGMRGQHSCSPLTPGPFLLVWKVVCGPTRPDLRPNHRLKTVRLWLITT